MTKKSTTFKFDMSNQNDILVYYYLTKLDTDKISIPSKLKELILNHINENHDIKKALLNSYNQLSESSQITFKDL